MVQTLSELPARADEIGREWERLHGAINEAATIGTGPADRFSNRAARIT